MAKKSTPEPEPIVLTVTLPPSSSFRKSGTLVARQGSAAIMHEFEYTDLGGIAHALQAASSQLSQRRSQLAAVNASAPAAKQPGQTPEPATPATVESDGDAGAAEADDSEQQDESETDAETDDPLALVAASALIESTATLDGTQAETNHGQLTFI